MIPTTVVGIAIFLWFLIPGFVYYLVRRSRVPSRQVSAVSEVISLVTVSTIANLMVWFVFLLLRVGIPSHTPDIDRLLSRHSTYADGRFAYLGLWGAGLFLFAILLSVLAAIRFGPFQKLETILQGEIRDVAAWYYVFESEPKDAYRYVGCELIDGSYYGGYLDWYNTDPTENIDRELVLAAPLTMRVSGSDNQIPLDEFSRIILSAKQIQKILVSYVDENKK